MLAEQFSELVRIVDTEIQERGLPPTMPATPNGDNEHYAKASLYRVWTNEGVSRILTAKYVNENNDTVSVSEEDFTQIVIEVGGFKIETHPTRVGKFYMISSMMKYPVSNEELFGNVKLGFDDALKISINDLSFKDLGV